MLKLLRYLRGYVTFLVTGSFPHKIINSCRNKNIAIWDIKSSMQGISAKTYAGSYKKLRHLRDKKTRTRVINKTGLPFKLKHVRKRYGLISGVFASALLLMFLTSRIWIITVNTNDDEVKNKVTSALELLDIKPGVKYASIDTKKARRRLMLIEKSIAWDGINIKGCTLTAEINNKELPPHKEFEKYKHADLIASDDGQIIYQEIKAGHKIYEKGNTVEKGAIIVSGTIIDKYGGIRTVYAKGKVMALCSKTITSAAKKNENIPVPTGDNYRNIRITINSRSFSTENKERIKNSILISQKTYTLPFCDNLWLNIETFSPVKYNSITYPYAEIKEKLLSDSDKIIEEMGISDIVEQNTSFMQDEDYYYIKRNILYIKDIAVTREF